MVKGLREEFVLWSGWKWSLCEYEFEHDMVEVEVGVVVRDDGKSVNEGRELEMGVRGG